MLVAYGKNIIIEAIEPEESETKVTSSGLVIAEVPKEAQQKLYKVINVGSDVDKSIQPGQFLVYDGPANKFVYKDLKLLIIHEEAVLGFYNENDV